MREAVASACSATEALRILGLRAAGGNYRTLKNLIARLGLSTSHFDPHAGRRREAYRRAIPLTEILVEDSRYSRTKLKHRLYDAGLRTRRCELCGQGEDWHGRRMSLILDHINGVPDDNRIENLRIVCPNCAATLDTHCGRNARVPVASRACALCGSDFRPRFRTQRYCCQECGMRAPKPTLRKVLRPSYEQLTDDLGSMSLLAVARKYGVTDGAVRKWLRWYRYGEDAQSDAA